MGELEGSEDSLTGFGEIAELNYGCSDPRTLETTGKLQILQPIDVPSTEEGSLNP